MEHTLSFAFLTCFGIPIEEGAGFDIDGYIIFITWIDPKAKRVGYEVIVKDGER